MSRTRPISDRFAPRTARKRAMRPAPEHLEDRLLLYSNLGDHFVYASRITFSFMPDGTSVGGVPSALFSTLNANHPTAAWEMQIEQAASIWEQAADVNLALVPDGGEAVASAGSTAATAPSSAARAKSKSVRDLIVNPPFSCWMSIWQALGAVRGTAASRPVIP